MIYPYMMPCCLLSLHLLNYPPIVPRCVNKLPCVFLATPITSPQGREDRAITHHDHCMGSA